MAEPSIGEATGHVWDYFRNFEVVRSLSGFLPVWHVGQYCTAELAYRAPGAGQLTGAAMNPHAAALVVLMFRSGFAMSFGNGLAKYVLRCWLDNLNDNQPVLLAD